MSLHRHRTSERFKIPPENVITTVNDHYRRNSIRDLSATGLTSRKSIILARDLATSAAADEEICLYLFIRGSISIRDGTASRGRYPWWRGGTLKRRQRVNQSRTVPPSKPPNRPPPPPGSFFFLLLFTLSFTCVAVLFGCSLTYRRGHWCITHPPISFSHMRAHRHSSPSPTHRRS